MTIICFVINIIILLLLTIERINYRLYTQYVMISACEPYTLYLPVVISAWNNIGYKCIIVLVYRSMTSKLKFVLNYISKTNSIIIHLIVKENEDIIIISKLARIFAFLNQSMDLSTILVTADADILPINKSYYKYSNIDNIILKSFGINGYGKYPANKRWPMSYIMMTFKNWNVILQNELNKCKNILSCVNLVIKNAYDKKIQYYGGSFSSIDEIYMRDNIRNSKLFPNHITFDIHGSYDRKPCKFINKEKVDDIHLPRIKEDNKWIKYIFCIMKLFSIMNEAEHYIRHYNSFFNNNTNII